MIRRRSSLILIGSLASLALGCGDAEETTSSATATLESTTSTPTADESADEIEIREVLTSLATENDPSLCEEAMTQHFLDQSFPPAGEGAIEDCQGQQDPDLKLEAEGVRFESVDVDGDLATASFELLGRGVEGTVTTIALVRAADGGWQLDRVEAAEIIDRAQFEESFRIASTERVGGLGDAQADCLIDEISALSDEEVERRAVSEENAVPTSFVIRCVGDGSAVGAAVEVLRRSLAADPDVRPFVACAVRRLMDELTRDDALAYLGSADRETVPATTRGVLFDCGAYPGGGGLRPTEEPTAREVRAERAGALN